MLTVLATNLIIKLVTNTVNLLDKQLSWARPTSVFNTHCVCLACEVHTQGIHTLVGRAHELLI